MSSIYLLQTKSPFLQQTVSLDGKMSYAKRIQPLYFQ